jgi:hypothetical protein
MNYYCSRCSVCGQNHCCCAKENYAKLKPCETLFYVQDKQGNRVPLKYTDKMVFTSDTLDITVTEGSAIVDMEYSGGQGATGATGATGPAALESAQSYTPGKRDYPVGSVVIYNGKAYIVTSNSQSGASPDQDPAFSYLEITSDAPGSVGPTGATGADIFPNAQSSPIDRASMKKPY